MILVDFIKFKLFRKRIKAIILSRIVKKLGGKSLQSQSFSVGGELLKDPFGNTEFYPKKEVQFYISVINEALR